MPDFLIPDNGPVGTIFWIVILGIVWALWDEYRGRRRERKHQVDDRRALARQMASLGYDAVPAHHITSPNDAVLYDTPRNRQLEQMRRDDPSGFRVFQADRQHQRLFG